MSVTRRPAIPYMIPLFLALTALLCVAAWLLGGTPFGGTPLGKERGSAANTIHAVQNSPAQTAPITCIVIDAGHGGEDGGASSAAGLVEKDINLSVAFALRDLFEAAGISVVMTRTEDKLLYDRNVDFQGRKKVLDLAARRIVAEKTAAKYGGDSLFISIHMNAFPQTQYSGMQVWYSKGDPRSADIAKSIQTASTTLMPDNTRKIKAAGSNIYLLDRIETPAVLVECGFLSNPDEAERLSREDYRYALAAVIFGAVVSCPAAEGTG